MGGRPRQSNGIDGVRSEHGALARCKYNILESEAMEGGPTNAGAAGVEVNHGASANQEGTGTEDEVDETPQRTLPMRESDGRKPVARGPC